MDKLSIQELKNRILWLVYLIYHDVLSKNPETIKHQKNPYPSYFQMNKYGMDLQFVFLRFESKKPGFEDVCRCRLVVKFKTRSSYNKEVRFYALDPDQCEAYAWDSLEEQLCLLFKSELESIYKALDAIAKERGIVDIQFP